MAITHFQTISEEIFAQYLDGANHQWEYEPDIPRQVKKPDFRIHHNGEAVLSDVKQREATPEQLKEYEREVETMLAGEPPKSNARHFDPVTQVRRLIKRGREKFKDFNDHLCALVIYNNGNRDARLNPLCIYGTLLGDPGFTANFSTVKSAVDPSSIQSGVLTWVGDDARRYEDLKNISAVIALETYRIPNPEYDVAYKAEVQRQAALLGRSLTPDERAEIHADLIIDRGLHATLGDAPGLTVCANPFANKSFPTDLFDGLFDEHWTIVDGQLKRVFAGEHR